MAGIGFALKRLTNQDNLIGIVRAYTHATIASSGPWLFTVLALAFIYPMFPGDTAMAQLIDFRIIVVYNFGFSLMCAAPVYMVITRYLADCIHRKDITHTPTAMLFSMGLLYLLLLPLAVIYYGWYVNLDLGLRLSAIINLYLISLIWLLGVFLTALKNYKAITRAFFIGMLLAVIGSHLLGHMFGNATLLTSFNIGLTWITFSLAGNILAEYPYRLIRRTRILQYFYKYWELAVGGVLYNAAIWVDKCVMWVFAPGAITLPSKMTYYPAYDSAMFLSYLTIVPAMAIFIFSIETNFFLRYQRFYYDILEHKPLAAIRANHSKIIETLVASSRNFFVVQGAISLFVILTASKLFDIFHIQYMEIGIFRLGVLGAFFHVLALFELILLAYFDCRKIIMTIQGIFLITNALFTYLTIQGGFIYYGYGYFLSALVTFALASVALFNHIQKLPYHAFITNNNSVNKTYLIDVDEAEKEL